MKRISFAVAVIGALLALSRGPAIAAVKTQAIEYKQGDTSLQGFLAYDDAAKGKRPGVLIVHEWWGHNQHARNQAVRLAKAGYVGFALDMYGKGKVAQHPDDAKKLMEEAVKDPQVIGARFNAALAILKKQPQVDPDKVAAIGYCFGGAVVLAMARGGADLDAVAVFHGPLAPQGPPAQKGKVKARILAQIGGADTMIPKTQIESFQKEMKDAGANARVIVYPKAVHSFTNPDASKYGMPGIGYNAEADRKSWAELQVFFKQVFGS
jgi:dienelactone hydrolase